VSGRFENISPDHFIWKGISFRHDDNALKIGTDALLLASWVPKILSAPQNILDVGTGSGIIAILMAHDFSASRVTGIDPEWSAVQLAQSNVVSSNYQDRVQIEHLGLIAFSKSQ
jgi:tRNA1Val (adenine37-N6)-methyltransferase